MYLKDIEKTKQIIIDFINFKLHSSNILNIERNVLDLSLETNYANRKMVSL